MKMLSILAFLIALAPPVSAGSLTPPPGPPAPTMKTLDEVEARTPIHLSDIPLIISSPGSYYFAEDIQVSASAAITTAAIIIESSFVTIDFNGFSLRGADVSKISGIYSSGPYESIVIRNGHVTNWEEYGIYLAIDGAEVSSMHVLDNAGYGVVLNSGRVLNSTFRNNGLTGIYFEPEPPMSQGTGSCLVEQCEVYDHGESGIVVRRPVDIRNTISSRNSNGILIYGAGSTIENNSCSKNDAAGIFLSSPATDCLVKGNQCTENGESGIVIAANGCRIEENHAARNELNGIVVNKRSMFFKNTAYDNDEGNYSMVNEAIYGPIITTTNVDGIVSSNHPWSNFSYHTTTIGN